MNQSMPSAPESDAIGRYIQDMGSVPGWFLELDARIFIGIDSLQKARGIGGDLLEIGVYHGKSAILLGYLVRPGEHLMVCDVFESIGELSDEGVAEHNTYHDGLRQIDFQRQYLRFHTELPVIIAAPSTSLDCDRLAGSFRFIHIDGSHAYEVVREDIITARHLLGGGGVAVFDDWSQPHCPGVALALWEEYLRRDLIPLCLTDTKLYATWDSSGLTPGDLDGWAAAQPGIEVSYAHCLAGHEVRRYVQKAEGVSSVKAVEAVASQGTHRERPSTESALRRAIRQVAPPILVDAYRRVCRRQVDRVSGAQARPVRSEIARIGGRLFGAAGGRPRVLLLNDTRDQNNWGSVALTEALLAILKRACPEMELRGIPSISLWSSRSPSGATTMVLPEFADDYEETAAVWQSGRGGPEAESFITRVQWADLVIYNGEGSIYRRNHSAVKALFMSWYARKILGKPCAYLNGGLHLTHVEPFLPPMARRTLLELDAVTIRESWSLKCAEEFVPGLEAELLPDSVFYYAWDPTAAPVQTRAPRDLAPGSYFCVAGGQMPHSLVRGKDAPLCRLIRALQAKGLNAVIVAREEEDQYLARIAEMCESRFYGHELGVGEVLGVLRSAALQLTGRYHHFIFGTLWGVPSIGFSAMSHKVQGLAEWFGPLLKPVRNSTMLGMEWEETMAQAESYLAGGIALRERIALRARELGELTQRYGAIAASLAGHPSGTEASQIARTTERASRAAGEGIGESGQ